MTKKIDRVLTASISKNIEKGGAWLAIVTIQEDGGVVYSNIVPWTTVSSAKRWVKSVVLAETPKKNIKWINSDNLDEKGKPILFSGVLTYKVSL